MPFKQRRQAVKLIDLWSFTVTSIFCRIFLRSALISDYMKIHEKKRIFAELFFESKRESVSS